MTALPYIDGPRLMSLVTWQDAMAAIERAVRSGAPRHDPPRGALPAAGGELLVMPATGPDGVGVKLVGVAPGNPDRGLPRIQGVYVLFDADTLTPTALLDGTALTTLRTPAVSALAVDRLAAPDASSLVVFGTGPQAWGHVHAVRAVRPIRRVTAVGRDAGRLAAFCDRLRAEGVAAVPGAPGDVTSADVVVCATTARRPVLDGALLADHACVVAAGSHEPDARELDDTVFARAGRVVVEDRETALREAGDVIQAVASGALDPAALLALPDLLSAPGAAGPRLSVFKSVGMAYQDLAVATAAHVALSSAPA